jgi:hypothetical protein
MISWRSGSRTRAAHRRMTTAVGVALAAMLASAGALILATGTSQAAGLNRPKITSLTLSPSSVTHVGGTVHLHAVVKHTASCRISITPHLSGLPKTRGCSSGHLAFSFHVGANPSAAPRHFVVTLKATKAGHHVTKTAHLTQVGVPPTVTGFSASPVSLPASGGVTALTASVSHGSTCRLSASPAVAGLSGSVACAGTSYSQQLTLPANSSTAAESYSFTLQVTGPGGSATVSTHPVVVVAVASSQPGGGGIPPISATSSTSATLPTNANTGAGDDTVLTSVSCPAAGDCVAVGTYDATYNSTGDPYIGLIETYNGTGWTATPAPVPSNAYPTFPAIDLNSVSCSSATACVAVGEFDAGTAGDQIGLEPYIAVLSGTTWTAATVSTPNPSYPGGDLNQVSCAADGTCVAVGDYSPPGEESALIEQAGAGGSWSAINPALPGDADSSSQHNYLNSVSCTGSGSCTAVGGYVSGGDEYGLGEVLSASVWSPTRLAPTADLGEDTAVSCSGSSCAATGDYNTNNSVIQTVISGSWNDELTTPLPAGSPGSSELRALDCESSSSCVGVGEYEAASTETEGLIDYGSGTAYTAQQAPLPSDQNTSNPVGDLYEISCGAAGACVAAGSYSDTSDNSQGLLETESDTSGTPSWTAASPATPGDGTFLALDGISCFGSYGCVAVGYYENSGDGVSGEIVLTPS